MFRQIGNDWGVPAMQCGAVFDHAGSLSCKYPSSLSLGGTDSALHEVSKNPLNPRILETHWLSDYSLGWLWPCLMSISELGATPPRWSFFMPKLARRGPTRFTVRWRRRQGRERSGEDRNTKGIFIFSWEPALWTQESQDRPIGCCGCPKKSIAIFGYKQWLLSIEMKTKLVQHVESDWMREWECESERVIFEHRHENKSCSACPEDQLKLFKNSNFSNFQKISNFQIFSGSQLLSDFQTFFWHPP